MPASEEPVFSEKDGEIIAVCASVASGCVPCTRFHVEAASRAGADRQEILLAVRDAAWVRRAATEIMARAGGLPPAQAGELDPDPTEARSLTRDLASIGAAYVVNCPTTVRRGIAAARALGATDRQVLATLRIACGIREVAISKTKAAVGAALGGDETRAAACGCAERDEAPAADDRDHVPDPDLEGGDDGACSCGARQD